ncbi:MAG: DUF6345 domain-containing protein [Candidatus Nanopelagicales bacterium]
MRRLPLTTAVGTAVGALVVSTVAAVGPSTAVDTQPTGEAEIYKVLAEGMTIEQAEGLAKDAGVGPALRPDGSFSFVDQKRFATVPSKRVTKKAKRLGRDEHERRTVAQAVDVAALGKMEVLDPRKAIERAQSLLGRVAGFEVRPRVDHTTVEISDRRGKLRSSTPIDTTVTYEFRLGGLPVVGPGAKQRIAFAADGAVVQLSRAVRSVEAAGSVAIISPDEALERCGVMYGPEVKQGTPTLAYYAPPLAAEKATGQGAAELLLPHYVCAPSSQLGESGPAKGEAGLTGRLVPAAPDLAPTAHLNASRDGSQVKAAVDISGGQAPFKVQWSSSSTLLEARSTSEVGYVVRSRTKRGGSPETLTTTVTDANGIVSSASVALPGSGQASATGIGGAGGAFDVGIEQTVDEWQCAQDSANGFGDVMRAKGQSVEFDWRGASAFEKDFKDTSFGGWDARSATRYVDEIDAQWYTGHGWSGGFTFKGNVDDTSITPADARWGDRDLEWMQLESCQVLRDTNGSADYFARWAPAFTGLHLLNGFDTNAYCVGGGTGRRFAEYLFPVNFLWWELRPALTVQQAWASMANDLEPAGVRWRSISPMQGSVSNLSDKFWGQGSVGPDIRPAQRTGFISISGVS